MSSIVKSGKDIPAGAHKVYKGVIYDVWQWEQQLFDGSTATFERLARPDSAQVIAVAGDRIILQKQRQPDWIEDGITLPGGRIDEGESPLQGAQRELREETGYESSDWQLLQEFNPSNHFFWTIYTYVARACVKSATPALEAGERIEVAAVTFEEFLAYGEDTAFRNHDIKPSLVRARYSTEFQEEFRKRLFGFDHI